MDNPGDRPSSADETLEGRAGNIDVPAANAPESVRAQRGAVTEGPGSRVGRYKLVQKLGEGGFGVVFQAEQERPVRRTVAVKIIKLGMDTPQVIARFDAERQALAMMDHPNIAKVLDAGATDSGRPYFVMEMVKGIPITQYCDTHELATDDRLELFHTVCVAVQHAHQKGIIHRDLKPSNILVTLRDGSPMPKVIDFGIAKATSGRLTDMTLHTELNEMLGTPQYMSPEQAEMTALDIDTRSDIYSLGVLLYEMLVGTTPLDAHTLRSAAMFEMQRMIRESEPPRPSMKLATLGLAGVKVAISRRTDVVRLGKKLRGELDWIVLKAMEKDRTRRYDTAQGLALDVRRYLNDEAVLARPASAAYRMKKVVRKHKAAVVAVSLVALMLVLGITGTSIGMVIASRAKEHAITAENVATNEKNRVIGLLADVRRAEEKAQQAKAAAEQSAADAIARKRESDISHARGRIADGDALGAAGDWSSARDAYTTARAELKALDLSPRVAEFGLWDSYRNLPPPLAVKSLGKKPIVGVEWLADGRSAIALAEDGRFTVWDVPTGRTLRQFRDTGPGYSESLALSPDGGSLVTVRDQKSLVIWDVADGKIRKELPLTHPSRRAVFSRDGTRIVAGNHEWTTILEFPSCKVLLEPGKLNRGAYKFLAVASPNPLRLVGTWYGGIDAWDTQTGKILKTARGPTLEYDCAAISPDGSFIVLGDWTGMLRRWDFQSARLLEFSAKQESGMKSVVFTALDRVLSVDTDGWICEWDTTTRTRLRRLGKETAHRDNNLSVHPNGRMVLSPQPDGTVALWSLGTLSEVTSFSVRPRGYDETPTATAVLPDNTTAVIGVPGLLCFWDLPTARYLSIQPHEEPQSGNSKPLSALGLFPTTNGKILCASGKTNIERLRLWDTQTYQALAEIVELKGKQQLTALRLSKDGRFAIGLDGAGDFHVWNALTLVPCPAGPAILGAAPAELARDMKNADNELALSLPTAGISFQHRKSEMTLRLQDPSTGEVLRKLRHSANVTAAACSGDERWLVTGDHTRTATFWELGRLSDYEWFATRLDLERGALADNPKDAQALRTLGQWYAFRGEPAWGAEFLETAASLGAKISHLTLARCYWNLDNFEAAEREFNAALAANEAPADYLRRCLNVIRPPSLQNPLSTLAELIRQKPRDPELYGQRAKIFSSHGHFAEASADYDKALEIREDVTWRFLRGILRLYAGNQTGYLEDCKQMRDVHIHNPDNSHSARACKLCLLQPGAAAETSEIAAEIDAHIKAEGEGRSNEWNKLNKGMVEYRLGHFDAAVTWLEKARQSPIAPSGIITAELFEAMANFKAGRTAQAGDQLSAAIHRVDTELPKPGQAELSAVENWLICQIARREAEGLIR